MYFCAKRYCKILFTLIVLGFELIFSNIVVLFSKEELKNLNFSYGLMNGNNYKVR